MISQKLSLEIILLFTLVIIRTALRNIISISYCCHFITLVYDTFYACDKLTKHGKLEHSKFSFIFSIN